MSFKREGDDPLLLNRLKHKRVSDLLGEHVPEDEAKLLSNGRLTCLICSYRPIFDTMKILVIHRKGKRHTQELHKYLAHKAKVEFELAKRAQTEHMKRERAYNNKILGTGYANINNSSKKFALDIPSEQPQDINLVPSASSQVRRYLKEISRKTPMSIVVSEMKESYLASESTAATQSVETPLQMVNYSDQTVINKRNKNSSTNSSNSALISMHMSGWIRDKFGNLIKDPEAEFDSSDEEPI